MMRNKRLNSNRSRRNDGKKQNHWSKYRRDTRTGRYPNPKKDHELFEEHLTEFLKEELVPYGDMKTIVD